MKNISITKDLVTTYSILDELAALLKLKTPSIGSKNSFSIAEVAIISLIRFNYCITSWKGVYKLLQDKYSQDFNLPHYKNFVSTMNTYSRFIVVLINTLLQMNSRQSGTIKIVDSTPLPVCKNIRIWYHKTMRELASRKKSTMGWFYGLKLHAVSDTQGKLIAIRFTTGNTDDRIVLDRFLELLSDSIIIADAGYVSKKLELKAKDNNNILKTCTKKNMSKVTTAVDIQLLNMRNRIEVLFSVLKERMNIVTSLPRSVNGYLAHYIYVIFGYMFKHLIS